MLSKTNLIASLLAHFFFIPMTASLGAKPHDEKPRVVVMTDGEIDDRSSMVRFLLHTNEIELLAIIQTNSVYQKNGWSSDRWIEAQIDAYGVAHPNLIVHDPSFPTPEYLRSILLVGDEDASHLVVDAASDKRFPRGEPVIDPQNWVDTPGSDRIVEILLEDDPRTVQLQAWGGGNTALRAFDKLKAKHPADYERAVSKAVLYNIWYQDGAGNYIERHHPGVTMVISYHFRETWAYDMQRYTHEFIQQHVKNNHGPLGALYPQKYVSEGDTPAYFYSLGNGLRSHEHPTYGGWGGRFYKVYGNVYRDVSKGCYSRWIEAANRDFEVRMDWCVTPRFEDANHRPVIAVKGALDRTVRSGEQVVLDVEVTDPNGNRTDILWWQYEGAGTYPQMIETSDTRVPKLTFTAPNVKDERTIHLIVEATNYGTAHLTAYKRFIITVRP